MVKNLLLLLFAFGISLSLVAQANCSYEMVTFNERAYFGDVPNLYQDTSGIIWMGVRGKGLAYYDGKKANLLNLPGQSAFTMRRTIFTAGTKGG